MARPSNRPAIIDAAIAVAGRDAITTVTVDAVAVEAGMTKAGVLYHFPTKEALLVAVQEHLAAVWEAQLVAAAGGTADEVPLAGRVAAYVRVAAESASRAELALMIEASADPTISVPLKQVIDRWVPSTDAGLEDPAAWPFVIARLAADGLWLGDVDKDLSPETRMRIADEIVAFVERRPSGAAEPFDG